MLLNTGTEANEVALKLAKMHTGRFEVVGLTRSFHGLLAGIASMTYSMAHAGYGPVLPGTFALPAPYAYRCPIRHCDDTCDCTCLEVGFELVDQQSVGSLCALVAEPILSAGGIIVPPDGYFRRVSELLRRARHAADPGRGADRLRPPRRDVRLRARRRRARFPRRSPRRSAAASRSPRRSPRARSSRPATTRASCTSPRTSPTRCPRRRGSPSST